jgi:hypothetical protein
MATSRYRLRPLVRLNELLGGVVGQTMEACILKMNETALSCTNL